MEHQIKSTEKFAEPRRIFIDLSRYDHVQRLIISMKTGLIELLHIYCKVTPLNLELTNPRTNRVNINRVSYASFRARTTQSNQLFHMVSGLEEFKIALLISLPDSPDLWPIHQREMHLNKYIAVRLKSNK